MKKWITSLLAVFAVGAANAHPGHDITSLTAGLTHPLALDHMLAMIAVGTWSVGALAAGNRWRGPLAFVSAMVVAIVLGASGIALSFTEMAIALTVVALALMLLVRQKMAPALGLGLIATFGAFHGLAHGAELPADGLFSLYTFGLLIATAALHSVGIAFGVVLEKGSKWTWRTASALLAAAGVALFANI